MAKGNLTKGNGAGLELWRERQKQEKALKEKRELEAAGLTDIPREKTNEPAVTTQQEVVAKPTFKQSEPAQGKMQLSIDPSKNYVFELIEQSKAKRNVVVGSTNRIFDTNENRIREIKYLPVANTIYVDEMDHSFIEATPPYLGFNNNVLPVSGRDVRLIEYLMAHDDNEDNPKRLNNRPPMFRIVDKSIIERKKTEDYDLLDTAREKIKEKDADDLRPLARIIFGIIEEDDNALRNKLRDLTNHSNLSKAAEKAKLIIENITNPKHERQYMILKGFDSGILTLKPNNNCVVWTQTGTVVCDVRNTKNQDKTAGELAEWTFTSEVGQRFWEVFSTKV